MKIKYLSCAPIQLIITKLIGFSEKIINCSHIIKNKMHYPLRADTELIDFY